MYFLHALGCVMILECCFRLLQTVTPVRHLWTERIVWINVLMTLRQECINIMPLTVLVYNATLTVSRGVPALVTL